ncbi:MAG: type 4a pilus biogenesis protein PilO [Chloroflexi bacterium]|nr:type 4a pilus biogenesis protein PilO [Chloroflexota bacterium]
MEVRQAPVVVGLRSRLSAWRPRPRHLVLAFTAVLLFAHAGLGLSLLHQAQARQRAAADVAVAQAAVARSSRGPSVEELRLALQRAEGKLAEVQRAFPARADTGLFVQQVLTLAQEAGLELVNLQAQPAKDQRQGQHVYRQAPFSITLRGQPQGLISFVDALLELPQQTTVLRAVQLAQGKEGWLLVMEADLYDRAEGRGPAPSGGPTPTPVKPKEGR